MWPTMLAQVNERFPRGGALMMGLMGFAGGLSIYFLLPRMGKIFDDARLTAAGGAEQFASLLPDSPEYHEIMRQASIQSFQSVAVVPVVLLLAFGLIIILDRRAKHNRKRTDSL